MNWKSEKKCLTSIDAGDVIDETNEHAIRNKIPFINVGYIQDIAAWGPFVIPGKTGCLACQSIIANEKGTTKEMTNKINKINRHYQAPSFGAVNMLAASLALHESLR